MDRLTSARCNSPSRDRSTTRAFGGEGGVDPPSRQTNAGRGDEADHPDQQFDSMSLGSTSGPTVLSVEDQPDLCRLWPRRAWRTVVVPRYRIALGSSSPTRPRSPARYPQHVHCGPSCGGSSVAGRQLVVPERIQRPPQASANVRPGFVMSSVPHRATAASLLDTVTFLRAASGSAPARISVWWISAFRR